MQEDADHRRVLVHRHRRAAPASRSSAGFFSKDEIIDNAHHNGYQAFFIVGLIGVFMTAAYMTRATYLTFFGKPRGAAAGVHEEEHVEEIADVHAGAVLTSALIHAEEGAEAVDAPLVEDVSVGLATDQELVSVLAADDGEGAFAPEAGHAHGHDAHAARPRRPPRMTGPHESQLAHHAARSSSWPRSPCWSASSTPGRAVKTEKFNDWVEAKPVSVPFESLSLNQPSPEATAVEGGSEGKAAGEAAAEGDHGDEPARVGCGFDVPAGGTGCFQPNNDRCPLQVDQRRALGPARPRRLRRRVAGRQALYDQRRARARLRGLTGRSKPTGAGATRSS